MNDFIDEVSKAAGLLAGAVVLLVGAVQGMRPWVLGLRAAAVFLGVWVVGYLVAYQVSRVLLAEALRHQVARRREREDGEGRARAAPQERAA